MNYINYCISLKDSQRKENAIQQFKKINLQVEFVDAVNGNLVVNKNSKVLYEDIHLNYKPSKRPLSPGEIGCSLSHFIIYSKILKNNLDGAFIFEDDVDISYTEQEFDILLNNIPDTTKFDICYYQSTNNYYIKSGMNNFYDIVFAEHYNRTHSYFITNKMAKILVDNINLSLRRVADGLLGEIIEKNKLTVLSPKERKISVVDYGSDIHRIDKIANYNHKLRR